MTKKRYFRKKHRVKKRKPFLTKELLSALVVLFLLIIGSLYLFVFHPNFQIEDVNVKNHESLNEDVLAKFIKKQSEGKFFLFKTESIFIIPLEKTREEILDKVPIIEDIIIKRSFPNIIEVDIKERVPVSIWCYKKERESCFYVDINGIAFQKTTATRGRFPVFVKEISGSTLGKKIVEREYIETFFSLKENLSNIGIKTSYFQVPSAEVIEVFVEGDWKIYFSLSNIDKEIENLSVVIEEVKRGEGRKLDYIDLRFGDRIYYK